MKVKIFGYRGPYNATERIETELVKRGHELSDTPEIVYHVNGLYDDAEEFCNKLSYKPKKIYNLLDIDVSKINTGFYDKAKQQLESADEICAISNVVKNQMEHHFGIKKNINVVPYPIRPITNLNFYRGIDFSYVGRVYSPNKRFNLILSTLAKMRLNSGVLAVVGIEKPHAGVYVGTLPDDLLNEFYNSSKFVFLLSAFEGQGCTAIEAVMAGSYPILCNDNPMVKELGLEDFAAYPNAEEVALKLININQSPKFYDEIIKKRAEEYRKKFTIEAVVDKIEGLF